MNTNPTTHVVGPQEGEAFWGFGALWTPKATAEQTGGRFSMIEETAPEGKVRRFTSIGRTTRRSTYSKESLRSTSVTIGPYRHPPARSFTSPEGWCTLSK